MLFTEVEMLINCKHRNIVTLYGFCVDYWKYLVIEHAPNGFLNEHLEKVKDNLINLNWVKRLKICLDVANGLKYLHHEMENQNMIINCSMTSSSIGLDKDWGAKIYSFKNSMLLSPNQDADVFKFKRIDETVYTDPQFKKNRMVRRGTDVYSFGVVLFELLCGRLADDPIYVKEDYDRGLAYVAQRRFNEKTIMELIDPIIKEGSGDYKFTLSRGANKDSLETFIRIAYKCLAETADQRPTMIVVVEELQKALLFQENSENDLRISLDIIKKATRNFHVGNWIGKGGFGNVYRGKLHKGDGFDTIVAKRLDKKGGQGEQQFRNELQILFNYKHDNVIRLVGYCDEDDEKVIVYEFAARGSLDRYLNDTSLTWIKRLNICIDVATALEFLHGGVATQASVIHRDIKTENILLNDEWKAKLADYGISMISAINQKAEYIIANACGTEGYVDPLYRKSGFLTMESDIYSFGVVLFEILCGRSTFWFYKYEGQFLPSFIKQRFEEGKHKEVVFEAIKAQIVPKGLSTFQTIAHRCLNDDRENRPTTKEVLEQLKKTLEFQISKTSNFHYKEYLQDTSNKLAKISNLTSNRKEQTKQRNGKPITTYN
ncbi:putative receptor-like protein kinase At1g72540 [Rutidosis leptorrhynchoides]|uniref:putative receptor-like protein kinase At1g72540 n=1 Tax=Rutidosis leptorrhynchoides TaxID=125765 RepID=UPI003A9A5BDB